MRPGIERRQNPESPLTESWVRAGPDRGGAAPPTALGRPISVRSRIGDNWRSGSCRYRTAVFESVNHDSSDANDAYLS
jgi:hypothetical protein